MTDKPSRIPDFDTIEAAAEFWDAHDFTEFEDELEEVTGSRIPTFKTIEEEAEFWDTHSIADFLDELEEVTDLVFVVIRSSKGITMNPPSQPPTPPEPDAT